MKKYILFVFLFSLALCMIPSYSASYVKAKTIDDFFSDSAFKHKIKEEKLRAVAKCESSMNPKAWNKQDPNGGSKGIFQFQEATFYRYAKALKIENPDIWDSQQQIEVASYMFSKGQQKQWSCVSVLKVI